MGAVHGTADALSKGKGLTRRVVPAVMLLTGMIKGLTTTKGEKAASEN